MTLNTTTHTLSNGMRIVIDHIPNVESAYVGVWCQTGARYETVQENGVAHFLEHMLFKGTTTRDAMQIASDIEDVGGQMNAYTGREITAYYAHVLKKDTSLAIDILGDMLLNSTFPDHEIETERGVVLQEIGMYEDLPDEIIFDHYQEQAYKDQSFGRRILGTPEQIKTLSRKTIVNYVNNHYTASNLVVGVAGNVDVDSFVKKVEDLFGDHQSGHTPEHDASSYAPTHFYAEREQEQAHILMAFECDNLFNEAQSIPTKILSQALTGGMSSRLFQEIREKRGLVYTIYSFDQTYIDTGTFGIYAGTDPEKVDEAVLTLCEELKKATSDLSPEEFERAKASVTAQISFDQESLFKRINHQAKNMLYKNELVDVHEKLEAYKKVSIEDVQKTACNLFSQKPTLIANGPLARMPSYDKVTSYF